MTEFLSAFLPTLAFMLVPLLIPVVAIAVGSVSDFLRAQRQPQQTASRAPSQMAQRDAAPDFAQAA